MAAARPRAESGAIALSALVTIGVALAIAAAAHVLGQETDRRYRCQARAVSAIGGVAAAACEESAALPERPAASVPPEPREPAQPVQILFWKPDPSSLRSSFGHVTLRVGDTYYDRGPEGWGTAKADAYQAQFLGDFEGFIYELDLSPAKAAELKAEVEALRDRDAAYVAWRNNCAQVTAEALRRLGFWIGPILTPADLRGRLHIPWFHAPPVRASQRFSQPRAPDG